MDDENSKLQCVLAAMLLPLHLLLFLLISMTMILYYICKNVTWLVLLISALLQLLMMPTSVMLIKTV